MDHCTSEINDYLKKKKYRNWHKGRDWITATDANGNATAEGVAFEKWFTPNNGIQFKDDLRQDQELQTGLNELVQIVAAARKNGKRVRAYGSRWSLNTITFDKDYMVHTWGLNYCRVGLQPGEVNTQYSNQANRYCFVQTGVMVRDVNDALASKNLALPTCGAADGQRFVGAFSTGTHGSANAVGSMQDYVKALHIVVPDGPEGAKHVLIQRANEPVVSEAFAAQTLFGAEYVKDTDLFNAALINFGCFGLIHGVLIEAEPMYRLKMEGKTFWYGRKIKDLMTAPTTEKLYNLGFEWLNRNDPRLPFHFNIGINPYFSRNIKRACVQVMQKEAYDPSLELLDRDDEDIRSVHETVTQEVATVQHGDFHPDEAAFEAGPLSKGARRTAFNLAIGNTLLSVNRVFKPIVTRFPQNTFTSEKAHKCSLEPAKARGTSVEIGVPLDRLQDAIDNIIEIMWDNPLPAPICMRYVKPSEATLAFTKFENMTVMIELPGADKCEIPGTGGLILDAAPVHNKIFNRLKRKNIPHTFHWGQKFPINKTWVTNSFGAGKVKQWKDQRKKLLKDDAALNMFANDLTDSIGLT